MSYIKTKKGVIIDLKSEGVSSFEIIDSEKALKEYAEEDGFICIYYFDFSRGEHIETDHCGGRSMDNYYLKDITIAEDLEILADKWVLLKEGEEPIIRGVFSAEYCKWRYLDQGYICYLSIFTGKGLIYKAEMKGILPNGEIEWKLL